MSDKHEMQTMSLSCARRVYGVLDYVENEKTSNTDQIKNYNRTSKNYKELPQKWNITIVSEKTELLNLTKALR